MRKGQNCRWPRTWFRVTGTQQPLCMPRAWCPVLIPSVSMNQARAPLNCSHPYTHSNSLCSSARTSERANGIEISSNWVKVCSFWSLNVNLVVLASMWEEFSKRIEDILAASSISEDSTSHTSKSFYWIKATNVWKKPNKWKQKLQTHIQICPKQHLAYKIIHRAWTREAYPIKSKHHKTDQSSIAINTAKENKSRKKKSNRMKTYRKTFPKKRGKKTMQTNTQGSKQWSFRSFWRALGDWKTYKAVC